MQTTVDRYSRQIVLPAIGKRGQEMLGQSHVVVIGCGALGTVLATQLVRAGVGRVRIVDRDFIEYHNLQRQILFDEDDVREQIPKAKAAERRLRKVNSAVEVEGIVEDVNFTNVQRLVDGADLIVDGLDNLDTRYLLNDAALKTGIPWIYGAAVATQGMTMTVIPGKTPCLRCAFPVLPEAGSTLTCDTAGVVSSAPMIVAALQFVEAVKLLTGNTDDLSLGLAVMDVWDGTNYRFQPERSGDCPACNGVYEFLEARSGVKTTSLCGQNSVQVLNTAPGKLSFEELARRLEPLGSVSYSGFMLRFEANGHEMVVFPDGRAIIKGTTDEKLAKGLYAQYVGA